MKVESHHRKHIKNEKGRQLKEAEDELYEDVAKLEE